MRRVMILIILVATAAVALPQQMPMPTPKTSGPQSDAQKAFEKLKTLAGTWEGTFMGMSMKMTIRVTSTGNAILHEMTTPSRPDDPITMIYVDGDRLLLTHFCDSGNRPRMQGKLSPDGNTVTFGFLDVSGNTEVFLMHGAASPSISMSSTKRFSLELYAQAFNLFNHTNLGSFAGVQTSPFFGHATSAQLPRRMELGMRFNF